MKERTPFYSRQRHSVPGSGGSPPEAAGACQRCYLLLVDERTDDYHSALASPARRRILDQLERSPSALTAGELAVALGLHVTTVRFHLEHLGRTGLVAGEGGREHRRGRPSIRYRPVRGNPDEARDHLIRVLAEAVAGSGGGAADPVAAGRRWADLLDLPPGDAPSAITAAFARLGFEPQVADGAIRLLGCPFREVARDHPEVVCRVHLGLAQRIAERLEPEAGLQVGVTPFVEPDLCLITLTPEHPPDAPSPV